MNDNLRHLAGCSKQRLPAPLVPGSWRPQGHPARVPRRAVLAGVAAALVAAGCAEDSPAHRRIRIATGSPTAVYHAIGTALKGVLERGIRGAEASVLATAASAENIELISTGRAEIGFTQADVLVPGGDPIAGIAALARVYDDLMHLVVPADSPIRTLTDLRGRRVSVGVGGSGTIVTVWRLLSAARLAGSRMIDSRELNLDDSLRALARGEIDAFFFSGGLPVAGIKQISSSTATRIVDLSPWVGKLREVYGDVYVTRDVPASVYRVPAIATVATPNLLVAAASLADDLAEAVTRLLMEGREALTAAHPAAERLDIRSAIATLPVPLHRGAVRYYRSVKP